MAGDGRAACDALAICVGSAGSSDLFADAEDPCRSKAFHSIVDNEAIQNAFVAAQGAFGRCWISNLGDVRATMEGACPDWQAAEGTLLDNVELCK
eukprot:6401306-Pyramimonas_sp.AAC.1